MSKVIWCVFLLLFVLLSCGKDDETSDDTAIQHEGMVLIEGGTFLMGSKIKEAQIDELPVHKVEISSFYMDITEVTNQKFKDFVEATGYKTTAETDIDWDEMSKQLPPNTPKPPDSILKAGSLVFTPTAYPVNLNDESQWWTWTTGASWKHPEGLGSNIKDRMDHPVVHISHDDALAYAKWAGKRLATEAEWEWAARGGSDENIYPWGAGSPIDNTDKANFWQGLFPVQNLEKDGYYHTAPVGSYPPNSYGLFDLAGNVWEWCADKYHPSTYAQYQKDGIVQNPVGPSVSFDPNEPYTPKFVMRGGSFLCSDDYCSGYLVSRRMKSSPDSGFNHTGFRCVKDVE